MIKHLPEDFNVENIDPKILGQIMTHLIEAGAAGATVGKPHEFISRAIVELLKGEVVDMHVGNDTLVVFLSIAVKDALMDYGRFLMKDRLSKTQGVGGIH